MRQQAEAIHQQVKETKQPQLDSLVADVAAELGADYQGSPKSPSSIVAKVGRKQAEGRTGYTVNSPKDHARGVIFVRQWQDAPEVVRRLIGKGFQAEITIDEPLNIFGYRGANLTVDLGDGINGEVQIHTPESWELKKKTDEIYRRWRNHQSSFNDATTPEILRAYERDVQECRAAWNNFWGNIPRSIKDRISSSGRGLDSVTEANRTRAGDQS